MAESGERDRGAALVLRTLAAATLLVPALLFAGFGGLSHRAHRAEAEAALDRTAEVAREHAVKVLETAMLLAAQVDEMLRDRTDGEIRAGESRLHGRIRDARRALPQVQDVWVLDARGHPLVAASRFPVPADLDASDREYFRAVRNGAEFFVSETLRGRVAGSTFFQVSRRRAQDGSFAGAIAISIQPDYFEQFYARLGGADGYMVALQRPDGRMLARFPEPAEPLDRAPAIAELVQAIRQAPERGRYHLRSPFDGKERLIAYQKLPDFPVYVTVGAALDDIRQDWIASIAGHLLFGVPATLGLFALTLVALRRTRRETRALARLREEVARRTATEAQLRQAQKMEAIGRLTGGLAHDFNNLLTVVSGNLEIAMRRLGAEADERVRRGIAGAMDGAARAAALTHRLLAFARQQPLDPRRTDVNRLVGGMSDLIRRTLGETVEMEVVLAGGLWPVRIDPPQLESALLNLAVNGKDAMPAGGRLTIETANAHLDDNYARTHDEVVAGQYVMIAISDTGGGMTPDVAARAFDPFFTTKPKGSGTGLGLSQVYGFVKQSGGHVKIYSEAGRGTTVKLYLPRAGEEEGAAEPEEAQAGSAAGDGTTLLVVEDDPGVRMFSVEALRDLGYRVVEAADAASGLRMIDQDPAIVLVFTDVVLPGGASGRDLADEARRRRPDIKIVFTTGYTQNAIVHNGVLDPDVHFLGKPFTVAALGRKIAQALGEAPP